MPLAWIPVCLGAVFGAIHSPAILGTQATQTPTMQHVVIDQYLDVDAEKAAYDPLTHTYTFERGVVARYDVETVRADRLVVNMDAMKASATGNVRLDDPDIQVTADLLEFTWVPDKQFGHAQNLVAKIANVTIHAGSADIVPGRYDLYDVGGTSCRRDPPFFELRSRHLTIFPEDHGRASRPSLYILGHHILTIPDRSFNLNPRTEGFNLPTVTYRKGKGLGLNFSSGFLVNAQTDLSVGFGAFPNELPGYGVTLTHSYLPAAATTNIVTPRSDLAERFSYGYLENILVKTPEDESNFLRRPRKSIAVESVWNQPTDQRGDDAHYSKPLEGVYELAGKEGGFGFYGQARMQAIRRNDQALQVRPVLSGSLGPAPHYFAKDWSTIARLDSSLYGADYGWVRGVLGVAYRPVKQVTLSAGGFGAQDFGHSLYPIDQLLSKGGFVFRGDFNLGPTKFSYMQKWNQSQGLIDREYSFSQVVGCMEPFVVYRKNPNTYNLGIRFRLDDFYEMLRRRDFRGGKTSTVVISPAPNGKP